ncbi:MAG: hypothetical protein H8F28_27715 [Fibrella sp.]|nr:hypothetical protein [Armatimonadota bacterium]
MNYLSHQYIARRVRPEPDTSALFFAGNLLPDLLAVSGDGRLRTVGEHAGALADGVRLHLVTDKQFHGLPAFHLVQAQASRLLLSAHWQTPPRRRFFLAHVMTEIALDAAILAQYPSLPDDLYNQLSQSLGQGLLPQTETLLGRPTTNLLATIEQFVESRFVYRYATPIGLASSLVRISQRAGVPNFTDPTDVATLAGIFEEYSLSLAPQTAELLRLPVVDTGLNPASLVVQ